MRTLTTLLCLFLAGGMSAQSTISGSLVSGGLTRDYLLYIPAAYTGNTAVPLVFNLHGYGSNNLEQSFYGDFKPVADTANFLMVLPNGTFDDQGKRFWNTFLGNSTVDDVGFMRDLLESLEASYNIDPNRVYSTGMSNGGFMSYALACEMNDRIAAIASVTGSMIQSNLNACNPSRPVPVMEIHGTADDVVPYSGAPLATFVAIPNLVNAWVNFNHCNTTPIIAQVLNTNTQDGCTAERQLYLDGDQGSTVEHYKINGGGHTWPGTAFVIGVTNQDFSASKEIWRFFRQYRLDQFTGTQIPGASPGFWSVFPNPVQDYVVLKSDQPSTVKSVRVFDVMGRLQQRILPGVGQEIKIGTLDWASGVYWVLMEEVGKTTRLSVVKR